jgi:hypothetical protein
MTKECNPETCKICKKVGLSILPLRYGTVSVLNQDGGLNKMPNLPDELGAQVKDKLLKRHNYALRVLRQGYIYLLRYDKDSSKEWFGWEVTEDGYCVPFDPMNDPVPSKPLGPFVCSKKGDNIPATMISVKDPEDSPIVYLMFAEHPLTKKKLKEYQDDKHDALAQRMQFFSPLGFVASKGAGPGGIHTVKIDEIDKYVIDYNKDYFPFLAYKDKVTGVNGVHSLYGLRPRHYMVRELNRRFEKLDGPYGIALALWDPVGITAELNDARNVMIARGAKVAGVGDEKKTRERVIADVIDGIRLNAQANPGPLWNRNFGPDRYARHINGEQWKAARKITQDFDQIDAAVLEISADFVQWKESNNWKWIARHEYDPTNHRSALRYEEMVAASVRGSGITQLEKDEVWGKIWSLTSTHPDNWLAASLAGMHSDFQSFFDSNKNWYREYDTAKAFAGMAKELAVDHAPKLVELNNKIHNRRAANHATAAIIDSLTGVMLHLSLVNRDMYHKTMMSVAKTLIVRAGVVPMPVLVRGTVAQIKQKVFEIALGQPRVSSPFEINNNIATRGAYMAAEANLGERGWKISQAVDGAVVLDPPQGRAKVREVAAWVVTNAQASGHGLKPKDMKALQLTTVDLTSPAASGSQRNPFLENHLKRSGAKLDVVLGAGALLFQVWTFQMMLDGRNNATDPDLKFEFGESMLTAALSAISAGFEVAAAYGALTGAAAEKIAFRVTWAARLNAVACIIDGIYLIFKGGRILTENRKEGKLSAVWTIGSGVFLLAAAAATIKLGAVAAASVLATSGAAAGAAVAIFGGPVVWTMIVVSLIGAAMYMGWQAMVTDKSYLLPVEYWLDSGVFGLRKFCDAGGAANLAFFDKAKNKILPFESLGSELEALQSIFLTATGRLQIARGFGTVTVDYEVAAPGFTNGAVLALKFFACDKGKRVLVRTDIIRHGELAAIATDEKWSDKGSLMRDDDARTQIDPKVGVMVTKGTFAMMGPPLDGRHPVTRKAYADQIELVATYAPNPQQYPGLTTTFTEKA